jgi:hypothetical protein
MLAAPLLEAFHEQERQEVRPMNMKQARGETMSNETFDTYVGWFQEKNILLPGNFRELAEFLDAERGAGQFASGQSSL